MKLNEILFETDESTIRLLVSIYSDIIMFKRDQYFPDLGELLEQLQHAYGNNIYEDIMDSDEFTEIRELSKLGDNLDEITMD